MKSFACALAASMLAGLMAMQKQSTLLNSGKQLQIYADLVKLYPDNEAYIKQYVRLLLKDNKTATAIEFLRHLHHLLLNRGATSQADALVKQFPMIGRVRQSDARPEDIQSLLPSALRSRLWQKLNRKRLREGEHLFYPGEHADTLYLLCEGELAEFCTGTQGKPVMLNLITAGDVIAEDKLLLPGPHTSDVVANKNSVVLKLPRKKMLAALHSNQTLKAALQRKTAQRRMLADISASQVLQAIPLQMRNHLAKDSHLEQYPAGSTIYKAGEQLHYVDLVVAGQASYQLRGPDGIKELKQLEGGALIGETAALHDNGCPADLVSRSGVSIIHIPYASFINIVEAYPPLRKSLTAYAEERRSRLMRKVNELQTQAVQHP